MVLVVLVAARGLRVRVRLGLRVRRARRGRVTVSPVVSVVPGAAVAMVEAALTATRSLRTVRSGAKVEQVEPSVRADQVATVPGAVPGASMGPTAFRVTEGMVAAAGPAVRSLSGLALVG